MNQDTEIFDVVIVGAGPAGAATAIYLGQAGYNVCLLEKKSFPLNKACGEGIMPTGVSILKEIGVLEHIESEYIKYFSGIRYTYKDLDARTNFNEGCGLGLHRPQLSLAFLKRIREISKIELHENQSFLHYQKESGFVRIQTNAREYRARLLIGADGLHSRVAKAAGLLGKRQKLKRWGTVFHFEDNSELQYVQVIPGCGVEAYITPCGPGLTGVAILWQPSKMPLKKPSEEQLSGTAEQNNSVQPDFVLAANSINRPNHPIQSLLEHFPELQSRLKNKKRNGPILSLGPLKQKRKSIVADGVVLVGDSAGYLDAITGEGISLALEGAKELGLCLNDLFIKMKEHKTLVSKKELKVYKKKHKKLALNYLCITGLALKIFAKDYTTRKFIRVMSKSPDLFARILSMNMGTISLFKIKIRDLIKIVFG